MTAAVTGSAGTILRLGNAFCDAQTLLTAVELDLFSVLQDGPATEEDLRARLALHGRGLRDFLQLLVQLDLLVEDDGLYWNTAATEDHLVAGAPGDVTGFLRGVKANLYPVWDGLTETLRSGLPRATAENFAHMLRDPHQLRRYSEMMNGVLQSLIPRLLDALDWSDHRSVLDVGGCQGSLVGRLVDAHPGLTGHVFDLPQLRPVFNARMAELGTAARVQFQAGDFFRDPLPRADVVILGHILHNWQREQREYLVSQAFRAVNPGGVLLVHDRMLEDECPRIDNLVASLTMALVTEQGSEYPVSELTSIALAAGFTSVISQALDDNETLVLCRKAAAAVD